MLRPSYPPPLATRFSPGTARHTGAAGSSSLRTTQATTAEPSASGPATPRSQPVAEGCAGTRSPKVAPYRAVQRLPVAAGHGEGDSPRGPLPSGPLVAQAGRLQVQRPRHPVRKSHSFPLASTRGGRILDVGTEVRHDYAKGTGGSPLVDDRLRYSDSPNSEGLTRQ